MKDLIQKYIYHHEAESQRLSEVRKAKIERLKQSGSFNGEQLVDYGTAILSIEAEMKEHASVLSTLQLLLSAATN